MAKFPIKSNIIQPTRYISRYINLSGPLTDTHGPAGTYQPQRKTVQY